MSKLEFKAEDFATAWCTPENSHKEMDAMLAQAICRVANARLAEMLRDAPVVFSGPGKQFGRIFEEWSLAEFEGEDTHRARLVNVERIDEREGQ